MESFRDKFGHFAHFPRYIGQPNRRKKSGTTELRLILEVCSGEQAAHTIGILINLDHVLVSDKGANFQRSYASLATTSAIRL